MPQYVEDLVAQNEQALSYSKLFIQSNTPSVPGPWIWIKTDDAGLPLDFIIDNGVP